MAPTMERIARLSFTKSKLVTDRFHVQNWPLMGFRNYESNADGKQ